MVTLAVTRGSGGEGRLRRRARHHLAVPRTHHVGRPRHQRRHRRERGPMTTAILDSASPIRRSIGQRLRPLTRRQGRLPVRVLVENSTARPTSSSWTVGPKPRRSLALAGELRPGDPRIGVLLVSDRPPSSAWPRCAPACTTSCPPTPRWRTTGGGRPRRRGCPAGPRRTRDSRPAQRPSVPRPGDQRRVAQGWGRQDHGRDQPGGRPGSARRRTPPCWSTWTSSSATSRSALDLDAGVLPRRRRARRGHARHHGAQDLPDPAPVRPVRHLRPELAGRCGQDQPQRTSATCCACWRRSSGTSWWTPRPACRSTTLAAMDQTTDLVLRDQHGRARRPGPAQGARHPCPARPAARVAGRSC